MNGEQQDENADTISRQAELSVSEEGDLLGVCLFLTAAELRSLNVPLKEIDNLTYTVDTDEGQIKLNEAQE